MTTVVSDIGAELRIRRLLAWIPQFKVAALTGITQNRLSQFELGKRVPTPEMTTKIRAAIDELLGDGHME